MKKQLATLALALAAAAAPGAGRAGNLRRRRHPYLPALLVQPLRLLDQLSRFNKTTGKVVFDKAAKTGSVDIVIDTKSVEYRRRNLQRAHPGRRLPRYRQVPDRHLQVHQGRLRRRQAGQSRRQPDPEGRHQAGHADRHLLPGHAAPDAEEGRHRRQRHDQGQAHRFQHGQVRPERRRRSDASTSPSKPSSIISGSKRADCIVTGPSPTHRRPIMLTLSEIRRTAATPTMAGCKAITRSRSPITTTRPTWAGATCA
jgi:hypothetical protein